MDKFIHGKQKQINKSKQQYNRMEILLPAAALVSLYFINRKTDEGFESLPNTNIPDRNYTDSSNEIPSELDKTSQLSVQNKTNIQKVYTDKYFKKHEGFHTLNPNNQQESPDTQMYLSINGDEVSSNHFQHNNMTPFFGGKIRTNHSQDNTNESILDSYSGAGSQIINKKESIPLFPPENNSQWAHGMPNSSDFVQSRINPVLRQANVKPFQEIKVGPGIGLGYTSEGSGGFNSGMQARDLWKDYTVDQLRTQNKPKASGIGMLGREGPAKHFANSSRAEQGIQEKHGPPKAFENTAERVKTTGARESSLIPVHVIRDVSRPDTTVSYTGGGSDSNQGSLLSGEFRQPRGMEYGPAQFNPAAAVGKGAPIVEDYQNMSKTSYTNNRMLNAQQNGDYFGSVRGYVNEAVAPLLDILRPSRKENTMSNTRAYQNPRVAVSQPYLHNSQKAKTTIRQTTDQVQWSNVGAPAVGSSYGVNTHQAADNARQTTDDFYYSGPSQSKVANLRNYEGEYALPNNGIKETVSLYCSMEKDKGKGIKS